MLNMDSQNFNQAEFDKMMKHVPIWTYFGLSKDQYLALPEQDTKIKIAKYYYDMSQGNGK